MTLANAAPLPRAPATPRRRSSAVAMVLLLAILAVWEAGTRLFQVPELLLPAPSSIAKALWTGFAVLPGDPIGLYVPLLQTLGETLTGFIAGTAIGIALAVLLRVARPVERYGMPYVTAFQALPKIALAPLLILWFGFGSASTIVLVATSAFFPVMVNAVEGFKASEGERIDLLRAMNATFAQLFANVIFPSAMPYIFSGLQIAAVISLLSVIVGEFVNGRIGLGARLLSANNVLDTPQVFAILFILGLLGAVLDLILRLVRRKVLFWAPGERRIAI